jgi:A/G-specific adenine glycosylase
VGWQRKHGRHDLPWQNTRDPYRIWLSEIMLQQTQVGTVLPYYLRFLEAFPDVVALANAPLDAVLARWSGLGYYRRAHHLHEAARAIVALHGGQFPRNATSIAALPGIGRSTASAIAAFAFGERVAILDGNVKRVLARHAGIAGWPGAPNVEARLWKTAVDRLPSRDIEAYTQGLMDLGATVCTRTSPRCAECPVAADCVAHLQSRIDELPSPKPRKPLPQRAVRVLLIERGGEILFEKRPPLGIWGGLWSLPECALDADVAAAVRARFGAHVDVRDALPPIAHGFTHFALTLHPQRLAATRWPRRAEAPGTLWLSPLEAQAAALPAPIKKLVRSLARGLTPGSDPGVSPRSARLASPIRRVLRHRARTRSARSQIRSIRRDAAEWGAAADPAWSRSLCRSGRPVAQVRRQPPFRIRHARAEFAELTQRIRRAAFVTQLFDLHDPRVGIARLRAIFVAVRGIFRGLIRLGGARFIAGVAAFTCSLRHGDGRRGRHGPRGRRRSGLLALGHSVLALFRLHRRRGPR